MACARCECPQCNEPELADDLAVRNLEFALLEAQSRPGLSDFWAVAAIADTYQRGTRSGTPGEQSVSAVVQSAATSASAAAFLSGSQHRLAVAATGRAVPARQTVRTPAAWYVIDECCPKGPPTVEIKPAENATAPMPPGTVNAAGGNVMKWVVKVTGEWKGKDADRKCSCACCELKVFVSFKIIQGGQETDSNDLGQGDGPYSGSSEEPTLRTHNVEGRTFVEDATFNDGNVDPFDIADEPERYDAEDLAPDPTPGSRDDPDTSFSPDGCKAEWTDEPRINLRRRTTVVLTYLALIRPKGCTGSSAWTVYQLAGSVTDGDPPTVHEEVTGHVVATSGR